MWTTERRRTRRWEKTPMRRSKRRRGAVSLCLAASLLCGAFTGCVDQYPDKTASLGGDGYLVEGSTARAKAGENPGSSSPARLPATSWNGLDLELVGRPTEMTTPLPERYMEDEDCVDVGSPMAPDIEIISFLEPDYLIAPPPCSRPLKASSRTRTCLICSSI